MTGNARRLALAMQVTIPVLLVARISIAVVAAWLHGTIA
jgi:hypothetical protein